MNDSRPVSDRPAVGRQRRLGKYRLVGKLGQGGMGVVYEAFDPVLRRPVAIKILPKAVASDPEALRRFQVEARAAARIDHPNAVGVYETGHDDGYHYIALELVRGRSAQQSLADGPLPWREATRVAADACRGLAAAHAAGVLHRDVKPGNVLCPDDGPAKLSDFGLAKFTDATTPLTAGNCLLGTPHFMSPEQCRSEKLDDLSDVYSLGATYFALLTGKPPYDAPGPMEMMFAHCSKPVPDARAVAPDVPESCAAVARRAMAKEPMDRHPSAAALLADLEAALAAPDFATLEIPPPPEPRPRRRRWIWPLAGAAAASALLLGVAALTRPPAAVAPKERWRPLFNGKDLAGWKASAGREGQWTVEDGELVGRGDNAFLVTRRDDFADFRLRAEVRLSAGGNSGLFFRCDDAGGLPAGYEAQIGEALGSLNRNNLGGAPPPWRPGLASADPRRWHAVEVRAAGPELEVVVDGESVTRFVERERGPARGRVGLQAFGVGAEVRFRRVEIEEQAR